MLTILEKMGINSNNKCVYKCKCDCGTIKNIVGSAISSGSTSSCGCIKSKANKIMTDILNKKDIKCESEYFIRVDKDTYFRFDIFIEEFNAAIEYDGEQHFKPVDFVGKGPEHAASQLEVTQNRDKIKNNYCEENDIALLRIPFWDRGNIAEIIENFIEKLCHAERLSEVSSKNGSVR